MIPAAVSRTGGTCRRAPKSRLANPIAMAAAAVVAPGLSTNDPTAPYDEDAETGDGAADDG